MGVTPTDPSVVTFEIRNPLGEVVQYVYATDPELVRDSAGVYHVDYFFDVPGIWTYIFEGTGAATGTVEGAFWVEQTYASAPPLCTLNDVRQERRDLATSLEGMVEALVRRASWAVSTHARREFAISDVNTQRSFPIDRQCEVTREVFIGDLAAVPTAVVMLDRWGNTTRTFVATDNSAGELLYSPRNRKLRDPIRSIGFRAGWSYGYELAVTGTWGFPVVPDDVREATVSTVIEWMKDDQALTLQSPDQFEPGNFPERGLPLRARDLLRPYRDLLVA